jgi:hypothetical protein
MPWSILATIAFILALVFWIAAGSVLKYATDAELLGFVFLSIALWAYNGYAGAPWASRRGPVA